MSRIHHTILRNAACPARVLLLLRTADCLSVLRSRRVLSNRPPLRGRDYSLLAVSLALLSLIVRAWLAHRYYGFQTGDDLEIAEEAFRRALGLVHTPWDIRNLVIPDLLVAPVVKLAYWFGLRDLLLLAETARAPFVVLSSVNVVLLFILGRRWYDDAIALAAAALYSVHWMPLVYGSSLYPRAVAVTCILGAAILLSGKPIFTRTFLAGLLAALAVTARYSEAMFILSLLIIAAAEVQQRRKTIPALFAGFATGIVLFIGLYDRVTWGRWFGSLAAFAHLTFIQRDASSHIVSQPAWWYLSNLPHWLPLTLLPLLFVAARRGEARRVISFVVLPLIILTAIFHKELRYLQILVPFALLLSARGFSLWYAQPARRRLAVILLALAFPLALARIGTAARRSTNAVDAALWMSHRQPSALALSQAWAYGGRLFLGNTVAIEDIGIPPKRERIAATASSVTAIALYSSDVDAPIAASLGQGGLTQKMEFADRGGRAVTVFFGVRQPQLPLLYVRGKHIQKR
jgi:hypothetical protein